MPASYDYIIIGGGLAGLQLALAFSQDIYFQNKTVAVIDPSEKKENDKTWCFWETGKGKWENLIYRQWETGKFLSAEVDLKLPFKPYAYKMIRSLDFYRYTHQQLSSLSNFTFVIDEISEINETENTAIGKEGNYMATHFFDSRITADYINDFKSTTIFQHFKGFLLTTKNNQFDPAQFTMMDYRKKYKNSTSFAYLLPFSRTKALVEFTFFTPYLTDENIYEEQIEFYVKDILHLTDYSLQSSEFGIIPMTTFPFHKNNSEKVTKIGTAGGWVKGSSGYSFKNTEKNIAHILQNIKKGRTPSFNLLKKKFKFYDAIFLDVLKSRNDLGEQIFTQFYKKNEMVQNLKFLDEETSLAEDLPILFSLLHPQFIRSYFKILFSK